MLAILELQLDIIKLRLLLEEWNDRYEDLKEENKKLKEELDQAYDFIDRYVYHRERIKDKDISDEEIEDIKIKLRKKLADDLHSIHASHL